MRKSIFGFVLILSFSLIARAQDQKPYLSSLHATKDSPLYTTYAAAMERSEFTLDEGYHFLFYDSTRGADFVTDNAGDWSLAFRKGTQFISAVRDYHRPPVISVSYPDIVRYYFYPYPDVRVDAVFVVHSSRSAFQDITVTNEGKEKTTVDLLPFLQNTARAFSDVTIEKDKNGITFSHEEFPDDWVLSHNVPYVQKVFNLFAFSEPVDRLASFRSYTWGTVIIPQQIELSKQPLFSIGGRMYHKDNSPCRHRSPGMKVTFFFGNDRTKILTENSPRWGSGQSNLSINSYYKAELGNVPDLKKGDPITVVFSCDESKQGAVLQTTMGDTAKQKDIQMDARFTDPTLPAEPENVKRDIWGSGTELRLYWKQGLAGMKYNVYRRDFLSAGYYELMVENMTQTFFTDKNIPDEKVYGYVVIAVDPSGAMSGHSREVNNIEGSDFLTDVKYPGQVKGDAKNLARVLSASKRFELEPGASGHIRILRMVRKEDESKDRLWNEASVLLQAPIDPYIAANEKLFAQIPVPQFTDPDKVMMYWSAFSLMRQVMLPAEGKSSFNYYVFSREPQWGWGHGGQVFHESITMLAYAMMDPLSAMNSQRVYRERQQTNGYINYRTGGFLDETIEYNGQLTSSAPWYAWQNWEVYRITKDKKFLKEMYESAKLFYNFYVRNRDSDNDGLAEWGGEAVLESVRDGYVAVWDQVGWPSNFESVDVNSMLVKEEKSLSAMAEELGSKKESQEWMKKAVERTKKINAVMWDEATGFYYNVDKKTHTFTHKKENDLKREEIIGFLPLWAGIASKQQAEKLIAKLTDPKKFWRKYGVPTLAADDPYYNPKGYWNGPVWIQWDYFVELGLLDYGYKKEASIMVDRVAANMIAQLKKDHNLWELYNPDEQWAGFHKTYIWAGLIARMMLDAEKK